MKNNRLTKSFFERDVLKVAPDLLGKTLVRVFDNNTILKLKITEVEAYRGEEDLACHACKGRTARTEVMYHKGGVIYVYLVYGMYWMLNFVTGKVNHPQAVLIRGLEGINGPGKITKKLQIDKSFYEENLTSSKKIWVESPTPDPSLPTKSGQAPGRGVLVEKVNYFTDTRIGVDYAGEYWANKQWRFQVKRKKQ